VPCAHTVNSDLHNYATNNGDPVQYLHVRLGSHHWSSRHSSMHFFLTHLLHQNMVPGSIKADKAFAELRH